MAAADLQQPGAEGGAPQDAAVGLGTTLRGARERRGVTLQQAAEHLRVDVAVIVALESEQFDSLGAPVFVRGHLRRYAQFLEEENGPLQAQYAAMEAAGLEPDLTQAPRVTGRQPPRVRGRKTPSRLLWPVVLAAGVMVLGGIVWLGLASKSVVP